MVPGIFENNYFLFMCAFANRTDYLWQPTVWPPNFLFSSHLVIIYIFWWMVHVHLICSAVRWYGLWHLCWLEGAVDCGKKCWYNFYSKEEFTVPFHTYISRRKQRAVDTMAVIGFFSFFRAVIRLSAVVVHLWAIFRFVDVWSFM